MAEQGIPIIGPILNRIIGTRNERFVKKYTAKVHAINALEAEVAQLTDAQIKASLAELRERREKGEPMDQLMVRALAVGREAMDRGVGIRSIFNPKHNFDPAALPADVRPLFDQTKAAMDALPPAPPVGDFLGAREAVPGWQQLDIPVEIYRAVRALYPESKPPFRARPFDVQLIGAMVLGQGKISEMKTGEGKTIVAPLASYVAAVERQQVHVVTVNDYLVQRDRDWTFPFFRALGMTVGAIHPQHMQGEDEKRRMYRCDVVYGTTAEFGFDYLRDNMKPSADMQVQRKRQFAIVDEVDSILIDEARTPLIISGPAHQDQPRYELADQLARHLVDKQRPWAQAEEKVQKHLMRIKGYEGDIRQSRDKSKVPAMQEEIRRLKAELPAIEAEKAKHVQYYEVKLDRKSAHLTHDGVAEAQRVANLGSFYVDQNIDLPHLLEQALRAHVVYQLDRDYVVMDTPDQGTGKVTPTIVIVDVNTGRPMIGRQWSDGLHQAVECKEKVPVKQETQTVATVTVQNYFKMYKRLAGMTGTADTEAQEFHDIYHLDVVSIPTNKPVVRRDFDDMVFLVAKDKWHRIVDEIKTFHDVGRPILVGTTSVEKSEMLSQMLTRLHGIKHEVLNAKQHERESHIIENAGQLGAVMIATNMAGRGTDIKLGAFTRQQLLDHWLRRGIAPRTLTLESDEAALREMVYRKVAQAELNIPKREAEEMPAAELELALLRAWANKHTWLSDKQIQGMGAADLRASLDEHGRSVLHDLRWFSNIEQLGGLHVIGTERHEARRIDNQLRGRGGRQGDRGSSRFFVSLEDDLMKLFAGETTMRILARLGMKEGDAIEHPMLSRSVERAQRKVEERNFQIRKGILEYDEVMEHQRQYFYGLRQRVLEGRDVKGLLLEYIEDAIRSGVDLYLDPEYPATCAAEFAKSKLDMSIPPDRLRGKDIDEMSAVIRKEALDEAAAAIDMTLGEYLNKEGSEVAVDVDAAGLSSWASTRFGVTLTPEEIGDGGERARQHIQMRLYESARLKIERADLTGLSPFLASDYGLSQLAQWAKEKFGLQVTLEELKAAQKHAERGVAEVLMEKARELYRQREIRYPVEFSFEMTKLMMQRSPAEAAAHLASWANQRFALSWSPQTIMSNSPQQVLDQLFAASEKSLEEGRLEKAIDEALAIGSDDALDAHLKEKYSISVGVTESMRYLEGEERRNAVRARVESILRSELLMLERTLLLETLDTAWKDHLYAMDQLRDSINFRAFSQQDPRIEYKREGSHMFRGMLQTVRDRVTDYIFRARLTPHIPAPPPPPGSARPAAVKGSRAAPGQARMG